MRGFEVDGVDEKGLRGRVVQTGIIKVNYWIAVY